MAQRACELKTASGLKRLLRRVCSAPYIPGNSARRRQYVRARGRQATWNEAQQPLSGAVGTGCLFVYRKCFTRRFVP